MDTISTIIQSSHLLSLHILTDYDILLHNFWKVDHFMESIFIDVSMM